MASTRSESVNNCAFDRPGRMSKMVGVVPIAGVPVVAGVTRLCRPLVDQGDRLYAVQLGDRFRIGDAQGRRIARAAGMPAVAVKPDSTTKNVAAHRADRLLNGHLGTLTDGHHEHDDSADTDDHAEHRQRGPRAVHLPSPARLRRASPSGMAGASTFPPHRFGRSLTIRHRKADLPPGVLRDIESLGDQHDGDAFAVQFAEGAMIFPRWYGCRGCRSVRRPGSGRSWFTARGQSRRAAAGRRRCGSATRWRNCRTTRSGISRARWRQAARSIWRVNKQQCDVVFERHAWQQVESLETRKPIVRPAPGEFVRCQRFDADAVEDMSRRTLPIKAAETGS